MILDCERQGRAVCIQGSLILISLVPRVRSPHPSLDLYLTRVDKLKTERGYCWISVVLIWDPCSSLRARPVREHSPEIWYGLSGDLVLGCQTVYIVAMGRTHDKQAR